MTGVVVIAGACILSMMTMDVFLQLQLTWVFNILFAAPFWIGMYWRKATRSAAWITVAYCTLIFFLIPYFAPKLMPSLMTNQSLTKINDIVVTTIERKAAPSDVKKRQAAVELWDAANERIGALPNETEGQRLVQQVELEKLGKRPTLLTLGEVFTETQKSGGKGIYWSQAVTPIDEEGNPLDNVKPRPVGEPVKIDEHTVRTILRYPEGTRLKGNGNFQLDYLLYQLFGVDLTAKSNAMLDTLSLPPKIVTPFLVMILFSLFTRRNNKEALDRYYAKMKTPVDPDPKIDEVNLKSAYANVAELESKKLFPGSDLEIQKPTRADLIGFLVCFLVCFAVIGLAVLVVGIGAPK